MSVTDKKIMIIPEKFDRNPAPGLQKSGMVSFNDLLGEVHKLWITGNIVSAIEKFKEKGADADLGKLYHAYLWLREEIITRGPDYEQQLNLFNSVFLTIIEERGATETGLYISVLKDSPEYRFFNDHVKNSAALQIGDQIEITGPSVVPVEPEKRITLKEILHSDEGGLKNCSIELWNSLIHDYFAVVKDEKTFAAESEKIIDKVKSIITGEHFHLELLIVYSIERLSSFKALTVESKDYAMKLINMMRGSNNIWRKLHKEYLLIIRKPSPSDSKRRAR